MNLLCSYCNSSPMMVCQLRNVIVSIIPRTWINKKMIFSTKVTTYKIINLQIGLEIFLFYDLEHLKCVIIIKKISFLPINKYTHYQYFI